MEHLLSNPYVIHATVEGLMGELSMYFMDYTNILDQ
jgi:hypothetical protein